MKKIFLVCMTLVSIIPFSTIVVANDNTPEEEKMIELTNNKDYGSNEQTLQVPVTATLSNQVVNVQFTGSVPVATVTVTNVTTGSTNSTTLPTTSGTIVTLPVTAGMGVVTITDEESGESVSGEFEVEE